MITTALLCALAVVLLALGMYLVWLCREMLAMLPFLSGSVGINIMFAFFFGSLGVSIAILVTRFLWTVTL